MIFQGAIKYLKPIIPVISLPRPSTLPNNVSSEPNNEVNPSIRLSDIIHSPKAYIFPNTNADFSKNTVKALILFSSPAHSSNSFIKTVAASFVNSEIKGPKRGCTHPKALFIIFAILPPKSDFLYFFFFLVSKYDDNTFLPAILSWRFSAS